MLERPGPRSDCVITATLRVGNAVLGQGRSNLAESECAGSIFQSRYEPEAG